MMYTNKDSNLISDSYVSSLTLLLGLCIIGLCNSELCYNII